MPPLNAFASSAAVLLVITVLLWFTIGTQRNIRKGNQLLRWLQDGLPVLADRTALRWLGSSAVQLTIERPKPPFKEAEIVIMLEPRDLPWFWAFGRARGRRDMLILRGRLRRGPTYDMEAYAPHGWTARDAQRRVDPSWDTQRWGSSIQVAHSRGADIDTARTSWSALEQASGGLWRLSVRRDPPHLHVHALPPDTATVSSEVLVRAFRNLALTVG
jgi:hypothetical protein